MDTVLGVSMAPTTVRIVLVEGQNADGATVDEDNFAVTDGGKEVALKWIRSNLDIEMRGVAQCLNLKHPNLVHLYDIRTDAAGEHWLVMEYVEGDSLRAILDRHPLNSIQHRRTHAK